MSILSQYNQAICKRKDATHQERRTAGVIRIWYVDTWKGLDVRMTL
jgi:hypothetical protein